MLHLISYSFPPDNVPASHRPHELAKLLRDSGIGFRAYTRNGLVTEDWLDEVDSKSTVSKPTKTKKKVATKRIVSGLFGWLLEVDKGLVWALFTVPRVWIDLLVAWIRVRKRPVVWATAPLPSNILVAAIAAFFSGSRLSIDFRDLLDGMDGQTRMPLLTRFAIAYSSSVSVVSPPFQDVLRARFPDINPRLVYNGISSSQAGALPTREFSRGDTIQITYAGALYGGHRPIEHAISLLQCALGEESLNSCRISLNVAGRNDMPDLAEGFSENRFNMSLLGEVDQNTAFGLASSSNVNLLLVGSGIRHRNAIPKKLFDLMDAGRPLLYVGPRDSAADKCAVEFIVAPYHAVYVDAGLDESVKGLSDWLDKHAFSRSRPTEHPQAAEECGKIVSMLGLKSASGGKGL